jgi:phosphatidylinositol-3,4,5-trisphosphate 3-phosphatase/dual-specificity protein phosphatase PTEN
MDLEGMRGEKRHQSGRAKISKLVENLASSGDEDGITDDETGKAGEPMAANKEASDIADKLNEVFNLHTSQRMKPSSLVKQGDDVEHQPAKKPVRGVSIPSQRRFVGYWSRVLTKQDPRPLNLLAPPKPPHNERNRRQAHIAEIRVYMPAQMPGFPAIISNKNLSVHLGRYKTSFVDELERQDLDLREMRRLEKRERKEGALSAEKASRLNQLKNDWNIWNDDNWDDKAKMFEGEGVLIEARDGTDKSDATSKGSTFRRLVPKSDNTSVPHRIAVDADREVQLKILVGDSGKKHSLLPDVVRSCQILTMAVKTDVSYSFRVAWGISG